MVAFANLNERKARVLNCVGDDRLGRRVVAVDIDANEAILHVDGRMGDALDACELHFDIGNALRAAHPVDNEGVTAVGQRGRPRDGGGGGVSRCLTGGERRDEENERKNDGTSAKKAPMDGVVASIGISIY